MAERSVQTICAPPLNRIVRYTKDAVGNDLTAILCWCETHNEPVWLYADGSYACPHTLIVEIDTEDHVLVSGPWETA